MIALFTGLIAISAIVLLFVQATINKRASAASHAESDESPEEASDCPTVMADAG